jgi:transposase
MNQLKDLIHYIFKRPDLPCRALAALAGVSKSSVSRYRRLIQRSNRSPAELMGLSLKDLDALFNRRAPTVRKQRPDFACVKAELNPQKGVTLKLLWREWRASVDQPAIGYSRLCALYGAYDTASQAVMTQHHEPGYAVYVDFSGKTLAYTDPHTGKKVDVQIFVATLPASDLVHITCVPTQSEIDWIEAHNRCFAYFGGTPKAIVPDNLRAAVKRPGPERLLLNHVYQQFAEHHGMAVLPARPYRPRHKGKVENAVRITQHDVLAPLRHTTFLSIEAMEKAVSALRDELNVKPFQRSADCRNDRFQRMEKAALRPLPAEPFVYREWLARQKVPPTYHVAVKKHRYSVPVELIGKFVEVCLSPDSVEVYHHRELVASHRRNHVPNGRTTAWEHLPEHHRARASSTMEGFRSWAQGMGPATVQLVEWQFTRKVPLQGLPACEALRNLARDHERAAFEHAARLAVDRKQMTVADVRHFLKNPSARKRGPWWEPTPVEYVRGPVYYEPPRRAA